MKKQLIAIRHDSGNCRLYVQDQNKQRYVLLDQGHLQEKWGLPRFELHTHSDDGEPDTPLCVPWLLMEGVEGTVFCTGLQHFTDPKDMMIKTEISD